MPQGRRRPQSPPLGREIAGPTAAGTVGHKPEPPPQQHLRPPESQSYLPKEGDPQPKAMPTKPPQTTQSPQDQPAPTDRPGSSNDALQDLSAADPATVYTPRPGQDLDIASFRALDQPGASTKPYIFHNHCSATLITSLSSACFLTAAHGSASTEAHRLQWSQNPTTGGIPCMPLTEAAAYKVGLCSSCRILCASFQTHHQAQSLLHKPTTQPRILPGTSSGRGSLYQPTIAHLLEDFGISDAREPTTHAPRTHPPGRLQYRLGETGSSRFSPWQEGSHHSFP